MTSKRADGSFYGSRRRGPVESVAWPQSLIHASIQVFEGLSEARRGRTSQSRRPNTPSSGSVHGISRSQPSGTTLADIPSVLGVISGGSRSYLNPQAFEPRTEASDRGTHRRARGGVNRDATMRLAFGDPTGHTFAAPSPVRSQRRTTYPPSVDIYRQTGLVMIDNAVQFARTLAAVPRKTIQRVIG